MGKTTIAQRIEDSHPGIRVYQGDRIGLPSDEILASYGPTEGAGGPGQRGFALYWIGEIASVLRVGQPVLLETQCRIAFLHEALNRYGIEQARIVLLECSDGVRDERLQKRGHPELANESMSIWSRFLHREAQIHGHEIIDTSDLTFEKSTARILNYFTVGYGKEAR